MNFNLISIMGNILESTLASGVVGRSFANGKNQLNIINPRQFTGDVHQTVDDRPFGGGDGMLMLAEPLEQSLQSLSLDQRGPVLFMSPQGRLWTDEMAAKFSVEENLTIICARYGGIDQRFLNAHDIQEISIGDYVISGGELAAAVVIDSIVRKIPGVLGHVDSAQVDSFADQGLLEAPAFTRPQEWQGQSVPAVLTEGHHEKIEKYRKTLGILVTLQKRPELISQNEPLEWDELEKFLRELSDGDIKSLGLKKKIILEQIEKRKS